MDDRHRRTRDFFESVVGQKLVDVTTHYQQANIDSDLGAFIELSFGNGNTARFYSEQGRISIWPGNRGSDRDAC